MRFHRVVLAVVLGLFVSMPRRSDAESYAFTRVARTSGSLSALSPHASVNNRGTVVFLADLDADEDGIVTDSDGTTAIVADSSDLLSPSDAAPSTSSRRSGGALWALLLLGIFGGGGGGGGGAPHSIADDNVPSSSFSSAPPLNSGETVVFLAEQDAGGNGIVAGGGSSSGNAPSINTGATVESFAALDASGHTGADAEASNVVRSNDVLDGSTVADLLSSRQYSNDGDGAASLVSLSDGRVGSSGANAQATPEPSTLLLLGIGLAGLVVARRRRKA